MNLMSLMQINIPLIITENIISLISRINIIVLIEFFFISVLSILIVSELNKKINLTGIDINKKEKPLIPESIGIALLLPLWVYIALNYFNAVVNIKELFFVLMVSSFAFLGFIDDLKPKFAGKQRNFKLRAVLSGLTALLFSFLLFPQNMLLAFVFLLALTSFHNSFAGLNGWEVGSSFILALFVLFFVSQANFFIALIVCIMIFALLLFNVFPARVFPGDSGTFLMGSAIAGLLLLTGSSLKVIEFFLFYLPHFIDFFLLKLLSNPFDISQVKLKPYELKEDKLRIPENNKTMDFAKLLIKLFGPKKESVIVLIIWITVFLNGLLWLYLLSII